MRRDDPQGKWAFRYLGEEEVGFGLTTGDRGLAVLPDTSSFVVGLFHEIRGVWPNRSGERGSVGG